MAAVSVVQRHEVVLPGRHCEFQPRLPFGAESRARQLPATFLDDHGPGGDKSVFALDHNREAGNRTPVLDASQPIMWLPYFAWRPADQPPMRDQPAPVPVLPRLAQQPTPGSNLSRTPAPIANEIANQCIRSA